MQHIILANLVENDQYVRKVLPFLKKEYFENNADQIVFDLINKYINKYNRSPSKEALLIDLESKSNLNEQQLKNSKQIIDTLKADVNTDLQWLIDKTEGFCKEQALHNALIEAIHIKGGESKKDKGTIPQLLQDALGVSFDSSVGHDYIEDYKQAFEMYHQKERRFPTDLDMLNRITKGGFPTKTLNVFIAGTNVGKTLLLCHLAGHYLKQGKNVLYITLEMSEFMIRQRVDANLLDVPMEQLEVMTEPTFEGKIKKLQAKTLGRLIVKEYPTSCAGVNHFRHLVNELKIKKNFKADVIMIDYINLCLSSRLRQSEYSNTYVYGRAVAEEMRGFAVEQDVPLFTATQLNRGGFGNSDPTIDQTADSFGVPFTADFMCLMWENEQLQKMGQIMFKQGKNRYGDKKIWERFVVGVTKSKMRLHDVDQKAQTLINPENGSTNIPDDVPVMDRGSADFSPELFRNFG